MSGDINTWGGRLLADTLMVQIMILLFKSGQIIDFIA